jgi:hypothetical protein
MENQWPVFYEVLSRRNYQTELASGYRRRFEKYRSRLFTFLDYDGIPWNNNNAEHAIKAFARLRNGIGTNSTTKSMRDYLVLLSVLLKFGILEKEEKITREKLHELVWSKPTLIAAKERPYRESPQI